MSDVAKNARGLTKALCWLLGHKRPPRGWYGDGLYGNVTGGYSDGTGRTHFQVWHQCPRCSAKYIAARFHGHQVRAHLEKSDDQ